MAKKKTNNPIKTLLNLVAWITGLLVSLAVGFGMIGGTLPLPTWLGGLLVAKIAGWIVVITTVLSVIFSILHK